MLRDSCSADGMSSIILTIVKKHVSYMNSKINFALKITLESQSVDGSQKFHMMELVLREDGLVDETVARFRQSPCNCMPDSVTCSVDSDCRRYQVDGQALQPEFFWGTFPVLSNVMAQ